MRHTVLFLAIVQSILHSSLAAPRLSVADAPDEMHCSTHAHPPFVALVDVLGIDPNAVAVHAALGVARTLHFNAHAAHSSCSRLRRLFPSHPLSLFFSPAP